MSRRTLPELVSEIQSLEYDLIELKNTQVAGASSLLIHLNQTEDTYDFNGSVGSFYAVGGYIDFVADDQDYPFGELECDIWINDVKVVLGEGEHSGSDTPGFKYYKSRRPDANVVTFNFSIFNFSGSSKNYKLKFKIQSTATGTLYPAILVSTRGY